LWHRIAVRVEAAGWTIVGKVMSALWVSPVAIAIRMPIVAISGAGPDIGVL